MKTKKSYSLIENLSKYLLQVFLFSIFFFSGCANSNLGGLEDFIESIDNLQKLEGIVWQKFPPTETLGKTEYEYYYFLSNEYYIGFKTIDSSTGGVNTSKMKDAYTHDSKNKTINWGGTSGIARYSIENQILKITESNGMTWQCKKVDSPTKEELLLW